MSIRHAVFHEHASECTKYHSLYCYFFLHKTRAEISYIFGKSPLTISNWIQRYETEGCIERHQHDTELMFSKEMKEWLLKEYSTNPLMYLDEARQKFIQNWGVSISVSSVWRILFSGGFSRKVVERRAIEVKASDIVRFTNEINSLDWTPDNLLFLDEVSFDNRGMIRKRGYSIKGTKVLIRGEFVRKTRVSLLCFINVDGLVESYMTDGTFNRLKFFDCLRQLVKSGVVQQYPGRNSIWIMDGARIHCHENIVYYLRSCGIVPIFLPAYCPMFNPIEVIFGLLKARMQRDYEECRITNSKIPMFVASELVHFRDYNCRGIYGKCGYSSAKRFNPGAGYVSENDFEYT